MPRAPQEGLRSGLPLLEYGELIDLGRLRKFGLNPILDPHEIPVHPAVFKSSDVYTPEFANQVWASIPDSIRTDVTAIEAKVGIPVPVRVSSWGVSETTERMGRKERQTYLGFGIEADPGEKSIWVEPLRDANAVNLALSKSHYRFTIKPIFNRASIPQAKVDLYILPETDKSEAGIITWYSHNIGMAGLPLLLIMRNFAIMFNNLGLEKLGIK